MHSPLSHEVAPLAPAAPAAHKGKWKLKNAIGLVLEFADEPSEVFRVSGIESGWNGCGFRR